MYSLQNLVRKLSRAFRMAYQKMTYNQHQTLRVGQTYHTKAPSKLLAWVIAATLVLSGCGQGQSAKIYHVGILSGLDAFSPAVDGFKAKMAELGYVEGKNISYDIQKTNVDLEAYKKIAQ